jgi:Yip1-like protein
VTQIQADLGSTKLADARPAGSKTLPARLAGVVFAPRATYAEVAAQPRWFGAFVAVFLVSAAASSTFLSTEVGRNAVIDQQITSAESWTGRPMTDQQIDGLERRSQYFAYFAPIFQLAFFIVGSLLVAGIAYAVFNALLGGDSTFKQAYAVVVHSGVILAVLALFSTPLAYARQTLSSATNLGVFFPFLDESSFPARALGAIDLVYVWWMISLAIGLGVLYRRRTTPIATTILGIYVVIGLAIAAVKTAASGA